MARLAVYNVDVYRNGTFVKNMDLVCPSRYTSTPASYNQVDMTHCFNEIYGGCPTIIYDSQKLPGAPLLQVPAAAVLYPRPIGSNIDLNGMGINDEIVLQFNQDVSIKIVMNNINQGDIGLLYQRGGRTIFALHTIPTTFYRNQWGLNVGVYEVGYYGDSSTNSGSGIPMPTDEPGVLGKVHVSGIANYTYDAQTMHADASVYNINVYEEFVTAISEALIEEWYSGVSPINPDDPYRKGSYNKGTKGGGDEGKWVNPHPPTPVPSLPWQQILNAGLLNCYKVDHADLQNIADFLFDPDIFNELMKIGTDLYDYICGLYMVPVTLQTGSVEKLALGNVYTNPAIQKYVNLTRVTEQYYEIDCGSVIAEEFWGNALDYNPYTRVTIMLPYIGAKEISADEVMGKSLHLVYHIDILSGACVAFLYEILSEGGQAIIYQFSGNCLMQLPLNSTDHNNLLAGVAQTVIAGAAAAYTAGAGAAAVAAVGTASQTASAHITAEKQFLSTESSVTTGIASNTIGNKVNVERSGSISGALGFLGIQTPYLLIQRPTQAYPENFGHYKGFPCNQELKLGDLEGYTVVDSIILNGLVGTEPEIAEIYDLLSKGVII